MLRSILFCLCLTVSSLIVAQGEFITKWNIEEDGELLTIPIQSGFTYEFQIDWGDNSPIEEYTDTPKHIYNQAGVYDVKITGNFPSIYLNNDPEAQKLLEIKQWGTGKWESMTNAFYGALKMKLTALDVPNLSLVTSLARTFRGCSTLNADLSSWDVSTITSLFSTFQDAEKFNGNIANWNISNVNSLLLTFSGATEFDQSIGDWDVSNVTNFIGTFQNASSFNQHLREWNTESAIFMTSMFEGASLFNRYVGSWDVSNVQFMNKMFKNASDYNRSLKTWKIVNVINFDEFLIGSNFSISNYDNLLIFWEANPRQPNITLEVGDVNYCRGSISRSELINNSGWTFIDGIQECERPFITTWRTRGESNIININTSNSVDYTYNYSIDWENDGIIDASNITGDAFHSYPDSGKYQVAIYKNFPTWEMSGVSLDWRESLLSIDQWGDIEWENLESMFANLPNFEYKATDNPRLVNVTSLSAMFSGSPLFNGEIGSWDTRFINRFDFVFAGATSFNGDISTWRMDNAIHPLGVWYMFSGATSFNQPLNNWNMSNVTNVEYMFQGAISFNQPLKDWDMSNKEGFQGMFRNATSFNQDIGDWDVSQVRNFNFMFWNANAFNQPLNNWTLNTVEPITMKEMFLSCEDFNQDLDNWNVFQVTDMSSMFEACNSFNGSLNGWNTSNVSSMFRMFRGASAFNQSINHFDPTRSISLEEMFYQASSFNQPMNSFNITGVVNLKRMFREATSFNQDLSFWNVRGATDMTEMFHDAAAFDQSLAEWDPINTTDMTDMLSGTALSTEHYDATLESWANRDSNSPDHLQDDVTLGADGLSYCSALLFRAALEFDGWEIIGDSRDCTQNNCGDFNNYIGPDGGDWHTAANWSQGTVPDVCDHVLIGLDKAVSLSADAECYLIDLYPGSSLTVDGFELTVSAMISN